MTNDTNQQRRPRLPMLVLVGGMITAMAASCASEEEGFDGFDHLRGATETHDGTTTGGTTGTTSTTTTTSTTSTTSTTTTTGAPPSAGCETAFAYKPGSSTCFLDVPELNANRWGWYISLLSGASFQMPVYAGAGQCNLASGEVVGEVTVDFDDGELNVTFDAACGCDAEVVHIYVGDDPLPMGNNGYTAAPGQYGFTDDNPVDGEIYTFTGLDDQVYLIFHLEICCDGAC